LSELGASYESKNVLRNDRSRGDFAGGGGIAMEIKLLLICVITILTLFGAVGLIREYMNIKRTVDSHEERMKKLEEANRKRMPYAAYEELLNAMAALDVHEREIDFEKSIMENAKAHLAKAMSTGTKREEK